MRLISLLLLLLANATTTTAQSAAEHIAMGDRDYLAMNAESALNHFEQAAKIEPSSYEAFWKASRSAIDIGSYHNDQARRVALFAAGEQYARRALALNPGDAAGHFSMARALGKTALAQSARGRIRYATEIRARALECLRIDPKHPGCLHVMGMWNAEVMRLNSLTRMVAKNILGGRVFGSASWKEAVRYMEASVAVEPERIVHRIDLGEVYLDVGEKAKARTEFETVLRLPSTDVNDGVYKSQAKAALARI